MNPTTIAPNTGRVFTEGARYWLRQSDDYVMPRSNSRYEAPEGFVAVKAKSATELVFDNSPLDAVPSALDPSNPNHVGAAVSHAGKFRHEKHNPVVDRPMPVTTPRAMDDHITRERSLAAFAQQATARTQVDAEEPVTEDPAPPVTGSRRPSRQQADD